VDSNFQYAEAVKLVVAPFLAPIGLLRCFAPIGLPPQPMDPLLSGSRGIPVPPKTVAVGLPTNLVRRRPDTRAAELAAMAQSAQIGIAESNLYPAFTLSGTFRTAASNIGHSKLK
jgi:outer membrane protein TolC